MLARNRGTTTITTLKDLSLKDLHETGKHGMRLDGVPAKAPDAHQNDASKVKNENKVEIAGSVHKSVVANKYETTGQIKFSSSRAPSGYINTPMEQGEITDLPPPQLLGGQVKETSHVQSQGGVTKDVRTRTSTTATIYVSGDVEKSLVAEDIKTGGDLTFD
ncbi:hypothetical protein PGQ11_001670 [Apiospora arundinis]|uniref:Uncharacterized protein n=1 Tax=Apiospora arundinis TaxID=335852 RepID=A0ABR2JFK7_9PEZI